jgi:hypothetical protein
MSGVSDVSGLHALVRVRLASHVEPGDFETHLRTEAAVAEAWRLAGDCDYEVRLACGTLTDLNSVVTEFRDVGGLTSTILVLHRVPLEA